MECQSCIVPDHYKHFIHKNLDIQYLATVMKTCDFQIITNMVQQASFGRDYHRASVL